MNTKRIIREFVEDKTNLYDEIVSLSPEKRDEVKTVLRNLIDVNNDTDEDEDKPHNWKELPGYNPEYFYDEDSLFAKQRDGDESEDLNEISYGGIPELKAGGFFSKIQKWLKRYLTDKASDFLINASADEMKDTIHLINVLDPNDMGGVFKPKAIYLGGGIDFADDALSWRTKVEEFFGPDHVVKGERLLELVTDGVMDFKGLDSPAILNPLRAETVRDEDVEFQQLFKSWKSDELDDESFKIFREKIRDKIVVQDLYMLKVCDTNLINFDGTAGAGTFGEAQVSALKNSQVIVWLTNGKKLSNVSPWMMPSITKIIVGDEIWSFLENFK
jgi:hypothetical protein|tara:strand:- start:23337 stop:24326 length:990 start_codon:yes stop_codon:yes gene_type:complete